MRIKYRKKYDLYTMRILKHIQRKKLAIKGRDKDGRTNGIEEACPICFLYYDEINNTRCCKPPICTTCYFQLQCDDLFSTRKSPYCNKIGLRVCQAEKLSANDVIKRDDEEQKVVEAQSRYTEARERKIIIACVAF